MSRPVRAVDVAAGESWRDSCFFCESPFSYIVVTAITRGWPTYITVPSHGIPANTRVPLFLASVQGPASLNNAGATPHVAERSTDDILVLLDVNTSDEASYKPNSGTAKFLPPKDLSAYTPRGQIRRSVADAVLVEIDGDEITLGSNGLIEVALTEAQVQTIAGAATEPFVCILQLELVNGAEVLRPFDYELTVYPEGTKEP